MRSTSRTWRVALFWIVLGIALFAVIRFGLGSRSQTQPHAPAPASGASPAQRYQGQASTPSTPPIVDTNPQTSAPPIYRCGNAYGNAPCSGARVVEGPSASGFDSRPSEKLAALVAQGRAAANNTVTTVESSTTHSVPLSRDPNGECSWLDREVAAIDAQARRALPAYEQDRLRAERQRARDRQVTLHC